MPYAPHSRVQFGGGIWDAAAGGNLIEEWACGYQVLYTPTRPMEDDDASAHLSLIDAFFTSAATGISKRASLDYLKINRVGADGHYVDPETAIAELATPSRGANNVTPPPLQVALRVSWSNGQRSPRGKGGFYLPSPSLALQMDGRYTSAAVDGLALRAAELIADINELPDVTFGVASSIDATFRPVTQVKVGRVPDTIRRRRNQLPEEWVTRTVLTGP